jgi:hypothetical protein
MVNQNNIYICRMKISYSNYPILEKLHKGSLGNMPLFYKDKKYFDIYGKAFVNNWKFYCNDFKQEVNFISKPFYEATVKAEKSLMDLWQDIVQNDTSDFDVNGCYIMGDLVYMISYKVKKGSEDNELFLYMFDRDGIPLAMFNDSSKYKIYQNGWISSHFSIDNNPKEIQDWIMYKFRDILILRMFKTYAQVETKILQPNSKVKDINCKYVNDTKFQLTYLDSKWFTDLVKSDGFNVRGHFRLQPKKENGRWTKELIWISDFKKSGYTAKARITSQTS